MLTDDGSAVDGFLRWCLLPHDAKDLGGNSSALAIGDTNAAVPKVQLAFVDADYGTSRTDAPFDLGPWSIEKFSAVIKVCIHCSC